MTKNTDSEEAYISRLLAQAQDKLDVFRGPLKASRLLEGGEGSAIWLLSNAGKEEFKNDSWSNIKKVNFESTLPDHSNLLDQENKIFAQYNSKLGFYYEIRPARP